VMIDVTEKLAFYAKVRAKLGNQNLAVRTNGDTVEVFGYAPLTEISNRTYPMWHFVGKISDFS
jgi:hypothetical protein